MIEMGDNQLNDTENLLKAIYNDSPIGIELYDSNGKLIDLNQSCMELFGVSSKEYVKGFDLLEDPNIPKEHLTKLKQRETVRFESTFDFDLVKKHNLYKTTKSGKIYIDVLITPLFLKESKSISNYLVQVQEITERIIAEQKLIDLNEMLENKIQEKTEQLKKSEKRYQLITENLNDILTITNEHGQIEYINEEAHKKVMGYLDEDLISQNAFDLIHPDDREKITEGFKKALNTGQGSSKTRVLHKDGYYIWTETNGKTFVDIDGKTKVLTISRDITTRKMAEKLLKESEEKYRNLFNDLNVGLFQSRISDGKFIECNDFFAKMVGYNTREECLADFVASEHYIDPSVRKQMLKEIRTHGEVRNFEAHVTRKDGAPFWVNYSARIYPDRNVIKGAGVDITKRKKIEQELRESEEKFRMITEQSLMGIAILQDGLVKYASKRLGDIYGYTVEEMLNFEPNEFLKRIDPVSLDIVREQATKKQLGHEDVITHYEIKIIKKTGEKRWVDNYSKTINYEGKPADLVTNIDITERKEAELKLKESEEKFRMITDQSLVSIVIAQNGVIKYVNKQMEVLSGYSMEEMKNWQAGEFLKIIHPDYRELVAEQSKKKQMGIEDVIDQYQIMGIKKSGEFIWVENYSKTITYEGNPAVLSIMIDITEKKEAEEKLRDSEEKYRTLIDNILDIIFEIDLDGKITYLSPQTVDMLGYKPEELVNRNAFRFIHPDDQEKVLKNQNYVINTGEVGSVEFRIQHKEGHYITVSSRGQFIEKVGEKKIIGLFRDVTERKMSEIKIQQSEAELSAIYNYTPIAILLVDNERRIRKINKFALKFTDHKEEEVFGIHGGEALRCLYSIKDPKGCGFSEYCQDCTMRNTVLDTFKTKIPHINVEATLYLLPGVDNNKVHLLISTVPLKFAGEDLVLISLIDITDRMNTEQKLKESEEKFRTIAEQSSMGMIIQQDGLIKFANAAVSEIIEYPLHEISSWTVQDTYKLIYKEDLPLIIEKFKQRQNGDFESVNRYECRILTKYGEIKWVEIFTKPIIYQGKNTVLSTFIDITGKKQVEEELKEISRLKSELLSRTSHELKTPLVSIKGYADLLLSQHYEDLDFYTISILHEIKQGCYRLESLIKDLLETSKLETGDIELNKGEDDLGFLIRFCVKDLKGLIETRNHKLILDIQDNLITMFEKERLYEVIMNLLSNAIKYTPPNGKITIKSEIKEDNYIISVTDNGIGLTKEEKEKIFKKFGKVERYGKGMDVISEGSGLGLYISKKIMELHGGDVWVESKGRDKGSTFLFSLPIMKN